MSTSNINAVDDSSLANSTEHAQLRDAVKASFPLLVGLLTDWDSDVQFDSGSALPTFTMDTELHNEFRAVIPRLVDLFIGGPPSIRSYVSDTLLQLIKKADLRAAFVPTLPTLIEPLQTTNNPPVKTIISILVELVDQAEFRAGVGKFIPSLIIQLGSYEDRLPATLALIKFAQYGEFRQDIKGAMPGILDEFSAIPVETVLAALSAVTTFADYAEFAEEIKAAIPIITLRVTELQFLPRGTAALVKLATHAEFRQTIKESDIIRTLSDRYTGKVDDVRNAVISTIAKLTDYEEFIVTSEMKSAFPTLIKALKDVNPPVRETATATLLKLSRRAELLDLNLGVISSFNGFLEPFAKIELPVILALVKFAENAALHEAIAKLIPSAIKRLGYREEKIIPTIVAMLAGLAKHAPLGNAIKAAIPPLLEPLKNPLAGPHSVERAKKFVDALLVASLVDQAIAA